VGEDENKSEFSKSMEFALKELQGSGGWSLDRKRPYDGQQHTTDGKRGKTKVEGLTLRDVADCMINGFLDAGGISRKERIRDDLRKIDISNLDLVAAIQCSVCYIEKHMGLHPDSVPLR